MFSGTILNDQKIGVNQKPNCNNTLTICEMSLEKTTNEDVIKVIPKTNIIEANKKYTI